MKKFLVALSSSLMVFVLASCSTGQSLDGPWPNVVTSSPNYQLLANQLQGTGTPTEVPFFDYSVLMTNPNVDPHDYEPTAKDRLLLANADLVIFTGTEYDQFVETLAESVGLDETKLISADQNRAETDCKVVLESQRAGDIECRDRKLNPHVWFDLNSTEALATAITLRYVDLQPQYEEIYQTALDLFKTKVKKIREFQKTIRSSVGTDSYFFGPENLSNVFLEDLGLKPMLDISDKLANDVELSAKEMTEIKKMMLDKKIKIFAANISVPSPQVAELQAFAKSNGIPIMKFSESDLCGENKPDFGDGGYTGCYVANIYKAGQLLKVELPKRA